ncbi:unnamed protein product [Bursaphelenchus okinawaensis]|uniref:Uncharacterized protein n=1 Tax=Bursaphelenchus okinawaensis TaxID=465554 RepID=A0A811K8Y3_9BILA|nr:unnamed protein product [Bursaphelenchus okinawaensis]CAG9094745.1 unnamed protein product [Bursaphelenchus okinawaensis]
MPEEILLAPDSNGQAAQSNPATRRFLFNSLDQVTQDHVRQELLDLYHINMNEEYVPGFRYSCVAEAMTVEVLQCLYTKVKKSLFGS